MIDMDVEQKVVANPHCFSFMSTCEEVQQRSQTCHALPVLCDSDLSCSTAGYKGRCYRQDF